MTQLTAHDVTYFVHSLGEVIEPLAVIQDRIANQGTITQMDRESIYDALDQLSELGATMRTILNPPAIKDDRAIDQHSWAKGSGHTIYCPPECSDRHAS